MTSNNPGPQSNYQEGGDQHKAQTIPKFHQNERTSQLSDENTVAAVSASSNAPIPYISGNPSSSINQQLQNCKYSPLPNQQGLTQGMSHPPLYHTTNQHQNSTVITKENPNQVLVNNNVLSPSLATNPVQPSNHFISSNAQSTNNESSNKEILSRQGVISSNNPPGIYNSGGVQQFFHRSASNEQNLVNINHSSNNALSSGTNIIQQHGPNFANNISSYQPNPNQFDPVQNQGGHQQFPIRTANNQMPVPENQSVTNFDNNHQVTVVPQHSFQKMYSNAREENMDNCKPILMDHLP